MRDSSRRDRSVRDERYGLIVDRQWIDCRRERLFNDGLVKEGSQRDGQGMVKKGLLEKKGLAKE